MPSTTTTTVTIGSILDLLGPTTQSAGSNDDPSGFDTLLQATQSTPTPPISPPADNCQPPAADSHPVDRSYQSANEPNTNDQFPSNSSDGHDSAQPDPPPATKPTTTTAESETNRREPDHSHEESDDQPISEQLIAQSLAGLPTAPQDIPAPKATESTDSAATSTEDLAPSEPSLAIATKSPSQLKAANSQTKSAATDVVEQTNTAPDDHSQQSLGDQRKVIAAATNDDSTGQNISAKFDSAGVVEPPKKDGGQTKSDDLESSAGIQLSSSNEQQTQPTPSAEHDSSPTNDASQPSQNTPAIDSTTVDASNNQPNNAAPPVAPVPNVAPIADSPNASQSSNSTAASAVSGSLPRVRLPAQALVPAANASTRHAPIEIDSARLISRVVRAFSAAQERDGEIRLRLSPPELGSLRLDVRVENGALTAHLQTETDSARLAILDNLPTLRDRLADQGVRIERFDVDLMQRQPGGMPDQPGGRQSDTPEAPLRLPPSSPSTSSQSPVVTTAPSSTLDSSIGLNVIV